MREKEDKNKDRRSSGSEANLCETCGKDCDILFGHYSNRDFASGYVYQCDTCFIKTHNITADELVTYGGEQ